MKDRVLHAFNNWHNSREVDYRIDTPWHSFVAETLDSFDLRGKRILEIGCGRGGFACWLSKAFGDQYSEFIAADFSETAVAKGRAHADGIKAKNITWVVKDIMNIDLPSGYFDVVISCETIEHVPRPKLALKELYRVTKPGGALLLTTPNYFNFWGLYRIYLRLTGRKWTEAGQPINNFVMLPMTLVWLRMVGFKVELFNSVKISYPSFVQKKEIVINWKKPKMFIKLFGINSFFISKK